MNTFRIVVALMPQLLPLLLVGASADLLGGWNHTDASLGVLATLFFVTPIATAALLVIEIFRRRRHTAEAPAEGSFLSKRRVGFAAFLFVESLAVDLLVLSQLRMH